MEALVPVELIRESLLALDENSPEPQVQKVLNAVADEDVRLFLHDVLSLAKAGDTAGAEARIRLRKGEACPVADAQGTTQSAITSDANSDQVTILNDLAPPRNWNGSLIPPGSKNGCFSCIPTSGGSPKPHLTSPWF